MTMGGNIPEKFHPTDQNTCCKVCKVAEAAARCNNVYQSCEFCNLNMQSRLV